MIVCRGGRKGGEGEREWDAVAPALGASAMAARANPSGPLTGANLVSERDNEARADERGRCLDQMKGIYFATVRRRGHVNVSVVSWSLERFGGSVSTDRKMTEAHACTEAIADLVETNRGVPS